MVQIELGTGPLAKRTRSLEADPEIIMALTQPVNNITKAKKDRSLPKHNSAPSRAQEAGSRHNPALFVHPNSRVLHGSNVAPTHR